MGQQNYLIGIDLGGTNIKIIGTDTEGRLFARKKIPTESRKGKEVVIGKIISLIKEIAGEIKRPPDAIGVAVAGVIDMQKGICRFLTNFPEKWKNFPLAQTISKMSNCPVFLINDVKAITLGEKNFGAGKDIENFICLAIGTGIGGGIVIEGKLYFGRQGYAGEIGHQIIDPAGPVCGCGNRGCLEAFASAGSIILQTKEMIRQGKPTLIEKLVGGNLDKITPEIVARAAREGDVVARKIWEREAFYLGIGIANLVVILNPQAVIIAGGISQAFDLMIDRVKKTLRERIFIEIDVEKLKILKGKLEDMAGAIGAACWAKEKISPAAKIKKPGPYQSI